MQANAASTDFLYDALFAAQSWKDWEIAWDALAQIPTSDSFSTLTNPNSQTMSESDTNLSNYLSVPQNHNARDSSKFISPYISPAISNISVTSSPGNTVIINPNGQTFQPQKNETTPNISRFVVSNQGNQDAAKFVCNECFMGFRRNRDLKCHINKSHPDID